MRAAITILLLVLCGRTISQVVVPTLPKLPRITGDSVLCAGTSATLSNAITGGTWSSSNTVVAVIGSVTGVVTAISPGTATITYDIASVITTRVITVNVTPVAGTITGAGTVCTGATIALGDPTGTPGGTWSSGSPSIAAVSAAGVVTGIAAGTTIISYNITNGCGTAHATKSVTVNSTASAGVITGPSSVMTGAAITLTDAVTGGTWSASNSHATVSATGVVTGVTAGTVIISYTIVSSCGVTSSTKLITVNPVSSLPAIGGYFFTMCAGTTLPFWNPAPGGTWSISPLSVATVSPTGVVAGISAGTATLSYTLGSAISTAIVTVNASPAPIVGSTHLCLWSTMLVTDPTPGGVWSSGLPSKASVTPGGLVTAINTSHLDIPVYYTLPNGCRATLIFTIDSAPAPITGPNKVCLGATIALHDTGAGTWSGTNAHASVDGSGHVTGLSLGTVGVTFTKPVTGCTRIFTVTVNPVPAPISGTLRVCTGSVTFVSDVTTPGISWTSGNTSVATISGSGAVTGISPGTAVITYMIASTCTRTAVVTVNPTPAAVAPISGPSSISHAGGSITLSDATPGGVWSSSNTAILVVGSATGVVTAITSYGSANINYIVTNSFGCRSFATKLIGASPSPHRVAATVGSSVSIADDAMAGEWTSDDNSIAAVGGYGTVTALAPGTANISHTIVNSNGDIATSVTQVVITAAALEVRLQPNPNNGSFTVHGNVGSNEDKAVSIAITNMVGTVVYESNGVAAGGVIDLPISLNSSLANGIYLLNVTNGNVHKVLRFVIAR